MEKINCKLSVQQSEEKLPVEMCRLRHGLNENCLLNVFDYLDQLDLINLCGMDPYYKVLITKWTMKKKVLDLRQQERQLDIFQAFGKSIRKFKIYSNSLASILTNIVEYCEPGALTEIDLEINDFNDNVDAIDPLKRLTLRAMPFFSNLRKLKFYTYKSTDPYRVFTNFLTNISTSAINLQSMEISNFELQNGWLQNMQKLSELRLCWKRGSPFDSLISYLRRNPQIKIFEFRHQMNNVTALFDGLKESCPGLEKFSDIDSDMSNPYERFDESLFNRYRFLSKFQHLNNVTLMSYTFCGSDLYYALMSLSTKRLTKLKVLMNLSRPVIVSDELKAEIMRRPLPQFAALHAVEIEIWERNIYIYDPKWTQCDLRCQFLFHFLKQVKDLQYFTFVGTSLSNMDKVLEFAPNIRVLDLSQVVSQETHLMLPKIMETLRGARDLDEGNNDHHVLHLRLRDDANVRIFEKNNDWKDIINFTFTKKNRTSKN